MNVAKSTAGYLPIMQDIRVEGLPEGMGRMTGISVCRRHLAELGKGLLGVEVRVGVGGGIHISPGVDSGLEGLNHEG